jgi:hypothetical protein
MGKPLWRKNTSKMRKNLGEGLLDKPIKMYDNRKFGGEVLQRGGGIMDDKIFMLVIRRRGL